MRENFMVEIDGVKKAYGQETFVGLSTLEYLAFFEKKSSI